MEEPTLTNENGTNTFPPRTPPSPVPSILRNKFKKQPGVAIAIAKRRQVANDFLNNIFLGVPDPVPPPDLETSLYAPLTPRAPPLLSHSNNQHQSISITVSKRRPSSAASSTEVKNGLSAALDGRDMLIALNTNATSSQGSSVILLNGASTSSHLVSTFNRADIHNSGQQDSVTDVLSSFFASPGGTSPRGTPRSILRANANNENVSANTISLDPISQIYASPSAIKAAVKRTNNNNGGTNREDTLPRHGSRPTDSLLANHTFGLNDNYSRYIDSPVDSASFPTSASSQANFGIGGSAAVANTSTAMSLQTGLTNSRDLQPAESSTGVAEVRRRRSSGSINSLSGRAPDTSQVSVDIIGAAVGKFTMPFSKNKSKKKGRARAKSIGDRVMDKIGIGLNIDKKKKAESFAYNLDPSGSLLPDPPGGSSYDPFFFEDPDIVPPGLDDLTNATKAYFMGSLVDKRAENVKREMNEHFREVHPEIDQTLTLSQVRNLKRLMLAVGRERDMEISSMACAHVYLEKLILKNHVSKQNRRLIAACCLLLAAKVNDPKEFDYIELLDVIDKEMDVAPREVHAHEFEVYAALDFVLFIPAWEIYPHMRRILQTMETNIDDYLHGRKFFLGNS